MSCFRASNAISRQRLHVHMRRPFVRSSVALSTAGAMSAGTVAQRVHRERTTLGLGRQRLKQYSQAAAKTFGEPSMKANNKVPKAHGRSGHSISTVDMTRGTTSTRSVH